MTALAVTDKQAAASLQAAFQALVDLATPDHQWKREVTVTRGRDYAVTRITSREDDEAFGFEFSIRGLRDIGLPFVDLARRVGLIVTVAPGLTWKAWKADEARVKLCGENAGFIAVSPGVYASPKFGFCEPPTLDWGWVGSSVEEPTGFTWRDSNDVTFADIADDAPTAPPKPRLSIKIPPGKETSAFSWLDGRSGERLAEVKAVRRAIAGTEPGVYYDFDVKAPIPDAERDASVAKWLPPTASAESTEEDDMDTEKQEAPEKQDDALDARTVTAGTIRTMEFPDYDERGVECPQFFKETIREGGVVPTEERLSIPMDPSTVRHVLIASAIGLAAVAATFFGTAGVLAYSLLK